MSETNTGAAYEIIDVPVGAQTLRVGKWGNGQKVLVAAHGLTGTHAEFHALAEQLGEEATVIAPDLRGRGGSSGAGPPYGFTTHADDLIAVMDHLAVPTATLLGHSMGGFVVAAAAARHPTRVEGLVLVDGGFPVARGPLSSPLVAGAIRQIYRHLPSRARRRFLERLIQRLIGSTLQRLDRVFQSEDDYLAFWRGHPALASQWNPYVEKAFTYELEPVGSGPAVRSTTRKEAVLADSEASLIDPDAGQAVFGLRCPVVLVRASSGFGEGQPGLYSDGDVARSSSRLSQLRHISLAGTNHYTILLSESGAKGVAEVVREAWASLR